MTTTTKTRFDVILAREGVTLDTLHAQLRDLYVRGLSGDEAARAQVDPLLNTCAGIEFCEQCAVIFCPYGEPLHFHHDGCPCCDTEEPDLSKDQYRERMRRHHGIAPSNTSENPA